MQGDGHLLADVVDFERVRHMCDGLSAVAGVSLAVLDPDGAVLLASGWQDVCTRFHRLHDETVKGCLESDLRLSERPADGREAPAHIAYRCANGLWDVAFPLIVDGEHLASVLAGQFFYDDDEIDLPAFRERARRLGFDEAAYLEALARVPVLSHQHVERVIRFLGDFVAMLGELGLAKLREEQAATASRASSEALEEAQAMASLGRWELDLAEDRLDWSPSIFEIFEIDPEQFAASYEGFVALIHPDDRAAVDEAYAKSLKDHRPYDTVHRLLMKDGRVKWVHERCRTDYDDDGVPLRSVGVVQDITERRRAERALRQSENLLRGLFDNMPSGAEIYEVRGDGSRGRDYIVKAFNAVSLQLEGTTQDEVVGRSLFDLRPAIDEYGLIPVFRRVWQTGEPAVFPATIYIDEHHEAWYENHVFRLASGDIVAIYDDVTERVTAQHALARAKELLDRTESMTRVGGWRWDLVDETMSWTDELYRLHGLDRHDLPPGSTAHIARSLECYDPQDRRMIEAAFTDCAERGQSYDLVVPFTSAAGDRIWVRTVAQAQRENDTIVGVVGNLMDITEQRRDEREILRLNAQLERRVQARTAELEAANHELESFAYSISHDLRAPLRALDGFSAMLLDDYRERLDDRGRGYLARIRAADQHMATLIDALLELSRLNRGELMREWLDISAMAREIAAELAEPEPGRSVGFAVADGLEAHADRRLVRALLTNLLGNAWKFTARREAARIEVGAAGADGTRAFYVRDDGAGFEMAYAGKLFGAFQRLHGADEFEGLGIGLATAQRIVRRHGGHVWAEGAVEQGATFWFTLPSATHAETVAHR